MPLEGEAKRAYQREWMRNRKLKAQVYLGSKCAYCGSEDDLEFDHVDRATKQFNINKLLSGQWENLRLELDKCQLLCEDCHKVKSDEEQTLPIEHGHYGRGYCKGCSCDLCVASVAPYWRDYRKRRKT